MGRPKGKKDTVQRSYANSFSRQFLADHGIEMYRGEELILSQLPKHLYDIKLPNTRYYVGDTFVERGIIKKINSYEVLKDLGFCIISRKVGNKERWDPGQHVTYEIRRTNEVSDHLGKMPGGRYPIHVEHDPSNKQIRLVGQRAGALGYGKWIDLEKNQQKSPGSGRHISYSAYGERSDEIIDSLLSSWMGEEEEAKPIYIKEAAFMITDANEIICFPNIPDMPSVLITGMKRTGKSFCQHSIVSRFFWKPEFDYKIVILNDSSRETGTWCLPNQDKKQRMFLRKLNERPLPLPIVYLHPVVKEDYEKLYMGNVGFDITIPFIDIVDNHRDYIQIEGSAKYLTRFKDKLKYCKTEAEANNVLDFMQIEHQVPQNTANKIRAIFDELFDTKMTDISSEKQHPWKTSQNLDVTYNPLTACVHAGVLPVLVTEYVSNKPEMLATYFLYFVKDLFNRQKQDPEFLKQNSELLLVIDEAHNISGGEARNSSADFLLRRCVREGGPRRIGTILTTQKFKELPPVIKDNTMYLICFKNPGEASEIANQYNMGKAGADMIKDLEKFECIAYSTEYFIVYDAEGRRRKSKPNEIFKGRALPPYSMHKRPNKAN